MTSLTNSDWGGAFHNPIMKHHGGTMVGHLYPAYIERVVDSTGERYDESLENDLPFDELKKLNEGEGTYPYLFRVKMPSNTMGFGVGTYDYIVWVDDVSQEEFNKVRDMYQLPYSLGSYRPDIKTALLWIGADMLGKTPDELTTREEASAKEIAQLIEEIDFDLLDEDELEEPE